jgi:FAD/FMN-containing dehydrogenase
MTNTRGAEGFIAVSPEQRKKFWLDRSRTAAISRHTNAFKVNEDVVIPLPRMGDYCDGIERINIELSTQNKLALCDALAEFLQGELPLDTGDATISRDELIGEKRKDALDYVASVRRRWQWLLDNLDLPLAEAEPQFAEYGVQAGELSNRAANPRLFHRLQDYSVRTSWKTELKARLDKIFDGQLFGPVRDELKSCTSRCCAAASSWPCTCTPATATCTPTSRSTPTTTRCCRPPTTRSIASWRWRARSTA